MIPNYLLNDFESNPTVLTDVPFCNKNERIFKQLPKKLEVFIKEKYDFRIARKIKKVRQFSKNKSPYPSCKTY